MRLSSPRALVWAVVGVVCLGTSAVQADETGTFDVSVAGLRIGAIAYAADERGGKYAVRGTARASGIVGAFFDGNADTSAKGRVDGNRFAPSSFSEVTTSGGDTVKRQFTYANGIPTIIRMPERKKPQKHAAPASEQAGTLDPTTAAYAILRDMPESLLCKLDISMYDGARRSRLQLSGAPTNGDETTCTGTYTRVAGFSPKEMQQRKSWPVEISYEKTANGEFRVASVRFPTTFGNAVLRRR